LSRGKRRTLEHREEIFFIKKREEGGEVLKAMRRE